MSATILEFRRPAPHQPPSRRPRETLPGLRQIQAAASLVLCADREGRRAVHARALAAAKAAAALVDGQITDVARGGGECTKADLAALDSVLDALELAQDMCRADGDMSAEAEWAGIAAVVRADFMVPVWMMSL